MRNIGLDFGTCNVKASQRKKEIKPVKLGTDAAVAEEKGIPNIILYRENKKEDREEKGVFSILYGSIAKKENLFAKEEKNRIRNIKSHLQEADWKRVLTFGKEVNAYDVTLDIMKKLYEAIYKSNKVENEISATITVPVNFSKKQQGLVEQAAREAGFIVHSVISEPFAAMIFLMQDVIEEMEEGDEARNILVFDFGGGTLDLCLAQVSCNPSGKKIRSLSSVGISYGGNDINHDIYEKIVKKKEPDKVAEAIENNPSKILQFGNLQSLLKAIDDLKDALFDDETIEEDKEAELIAESGNTGDRDIEDYGVVSVGEIYQMFDDEDWKGRLGKLIRRLFKDADDIMPEELTDIFLVGGSSSIPYFQKTLCACLKEEGCENAEELFERNDDIDKENRVYQSVACGAVLYQELTKQENVKLEDCIPFCVYTKKCTGEKVTSIERNASYDGYRTLPCFLSEPIEKDDRGIAVYQTIYGEDEKEAFIGNIILDDEIKEEADWYRLAVDEKRNVYAEFGCMPKEDELLLAQWTVPVTL